VFNSSGQFDRRHDRAVTAGWAWGGPHDDKDYESEQILSTTLFRVYQACGGASIDLKVRKEASHYVVFLILKAIDCLTMPPGTAEAFVDVLIDADRTTTNLGSFPGGTLSKVIRWSFEKQGLYQPPGAPSPVRQSGAPPAIDVYLDDGRTGEYLQFLADGGESTEIWNRLAADGIGVHQSPVAGSTNYLYALIRNRGTSPAQNITVCAFSSTSPKTAVWPADWSAFPSGPLNVPGPIPPGGQVVAGPLPWTPSGSGEGVLLKLDAAGDPSITGDITVPIETRLLTLLDNNIAKRTF
jgi:hypothetical protein